MWVGRLGRRGEGGGLWLIGLSVSTLVDGWLGGSSCLVWVDGWVRSFVRSFVRSVGRSVVQDNNDNGNDNYTCISRASFHIKHAQLRRTSTSTKYKTRTL